MSTLRYAPHFVVSIFALCAMSPSAKGEPMNSWYAPPTHSSVGAAHSFQLHTDFEPVRPDKLASVEALLKNHPLT